MEAVRKPKSSHRVHFAEADTDSVPVRKEEEVETRVQGTLLPNVPTEEPGTELRNQPDKEEVSKLIEARENSASPEPEELEFLREDEPSTSEGAVAENEISDDEHSSPPASVYPVLESLADAMPKDPAEDQPTGDWSGLVQEEEKVLVYPNISKMETTELGLLSEEVLLSFYHNAIYEDTEQLVDRFCIEELNPTGPLRELLQRLRTVWASIDESTANVAGISSSLDESLKNLWNMQPRIHEHVHTCDEHNRASGTVKYEIAVMDNGKLEEIKKLLEAERNITLKKKVCKEIEAGSISLQIQWIINDVIQTFSIETNASPNSPPMLLPPPHLNAFPSYARGLLHSTLSDLFAFLRIPNLPERCANAAKEWVTKLTSYLHKSFLATDGLWLLCHILRLPSPSAEWTAPLIQNFMLSNCSDKLKLDYCVAMISLLMSPIKSRESFLADFASLDNSTASWMNVADETRQNPMIISESDVTSLLEQLPVPDFYTLAIRHFMTINSKTVDQFTSLLAFQLLLMKIFLVGLEEYSSMKYKAFCKQIGMALRKSVRELAHQWNAVRALLEPAEDYQLQREMDRIVLLGVNYVVVNRSLGLWQYLIDLPYDAISEECRFRVEYLLRKSGDEDCKNSRELFLMQQEEIAKEMRSTTLAERLSTAGTQDTVFLVQALAALVVQTSQDPKSFLKEVVQVCFVDEATRDSLYKAGREAIATIIKTKPSCFDSLITVIDRNIDHIEEHVMDIFASSSLHQCKISEDVVGGVIGKWLIGRSPDSPANRVARKILSSLNWGYRADGDLWLSEAVHSMCADIIVKAHITHSSSGIMANISKIAYGDCQHTTRFEQFCWQLLIKLKLPIQSSNKNPEDDLTAHFVYAAQHSLLSAEEFAQSGLNCISELLSAGCVIPAAVLLSRALVLYYDQADRIIGNEKFLPLFEQILHSDHLLAGSSPTNIANFLKCAITVSLQLLGSIARLAFEHDPTAFGGFIDLLQTAHKQRLSEWESSSQGYLTLISGTTPPPPLISTSHLSISPWASFICLCAEERTFEPFHNTFYEELAKDHATVEKACKQAECKSSHPLPMDRLVVFRWMELCRVCGFRETQREAERDEPVLALALQRLAQAMFTPRMSDGMRRQLAGKLYATAEKKWMSFGESLKSRSDAKSLPKAVANWIRGAAEISKQGFSDYSRFELDHLLRSVIAEDKAVWMNFVDQYIIATQAEEDYQTYADAVHGRGRNLPSKENINKTYQRAPMRTRGSRALPFPSLPDRSTVPLHHALDRSSLGHASYAMPRVQSLIDSLATHAEKFEQTIKIVEKKDNAYCELLTQLHVPAKLNLEVVVRCSDLCQGAAARSVRVNGTKLCTSNAEARDANRNERTATIASLQREIVDDAALKCAIIELTARRLQEIGISSDSRAVSIVQNVGRALFDLITSTFASATTPIHRFSPVIACFNQALKTLAKNPIAFSTDEQLALLDQVLAGSPLSEGLASHFAPEVLPSKLFLEAYKRCVNSAVRKENVRSAFALLSRFSTSAFSSASAEDLRSIMPAILINASAVTASADFEAGRLQELFMRHFIDFTFRHYPQNVACGLELALKGCNLGTTPPDLLNKIVEGLSKHAIDDLTLNKCISITVNALKKAEESKSLKFLQYKEALGALIELIFARAEAFESETRQICDIEDLRALFARLQ